LIFPQFVEMMKTLGKNFRNIIIDNLIMVKIYFHSYISFLTLKGILINADNFFELFQISGKQKKFIFSLPQDIKMGLALE